MKSRRFSVWMVRLCLLAGCGSLLELGCIRDLQREREVLFAPEANPLLLNNSYIVNKLGVGFLKFWQNFW